MRGDMYPRLYEVTEYAVIMDMESAEDAEPLLEGTFRECAAYVEEHPHTTIVWYDDDAQYAPSLSLH